MLPPELQTVMQQFPDVVKRLGVLEAKPAAVSPSSLIAAVAFLSGVGLMTLLVFLWFYWPVIFRL